MMLLRKTVGGERKTLLPLITFRTKKANYLSWFKLGIGYAAGLPAGHGYTLGDMLYRDVFRFGPIVFVVFRCYGKRMPYPARPLTLRGNLNV